MFLKLLLLVLFCIFQEYSSTELPQSSMCYSQINTIPDNFSTEINEISPNSQILNGQFVNFSLFVYNPNGHHRRRKRRSTTSVQRYIELLVVIDSSMDEYHGANLEKYILAQMSMVAHIFKHSSIGHAITIKLVGVRMLTNDQDHIIYETPHLLLRSFCLWQNRENHPSDKDLKHHDTAMFFTRKKLCGSLKQCSMVGLANVAQICNPEHSCFIVEDTGLSAAFTIAHELGHVLGIPHDDQEHCNKFFENRKKNKPKYVKPEKANIMASVQTGLNRIWAWSSCSRHFITKHLNEAGRCLLEDQDHPDQYDPSHRFAGRFYSVDEQCRLRFTKSAAACSNINVCSRLWCSMPKGGCMSDNSPWADGTRCGPPGMWCYQGECVPISVSMKIVDGKWGEWGSWSSCSKKCGRGWQESRRKCNRPKPKNGGHYCLGQRIRTRPCNEQPCKKSSSKSKKIITEKKTPKSKVDNLKNKQKLKLQSAIEDWFRY